MTELGFLEWTDGFNWQNIPSTVVDGTYHLELLDANGIKQNQNDIEIEVPIVIRLFVKGFRDPAAGIDDAVLKCQSIITKALKPSTRLTGDLKNVTFSSAVPEPFGESNDNLIMMRIEFNTLVILAHD
jgi:hypothetical protein